MLKFIKDFLEKKKDYSVKLLGRAGLQYKEGNKVTFVDSEILAGFERIAIFADSINRWEKTKEPIDEVEKNRILNNIRKELEKKGYSIEIYLNS